MSFMTLHAGAGHTRGRRDSDREDRLLQLDRVFAPVRVVMGRGEVSLGEVLTLEEGDILKLDTTIKEEAVVYVGVRPKFRGVPGLLGKRRAVQLTEPILKADEVNYMTSVEKTKTDTL
jgi:flagellar motor switch protein FliM